MDDCELCGEPLVMPSASETMTAHRECLLREVTGGIGHLIAHEWWCTHLKDPDAGLSYRQSALLTDAWVTIVGLEHLPRS